MPVIYVPYLIVVPKWESSGSTELRQVGTATIFLMRKVKLKAQLRLRMPDFDCNAYYIKSC